MAPKSKKSQVEPDVTPGKDTQEETPETTMDSANNVDKATKSGQDQSKKDGNEQDTTTNNDDKAENPDQDQDNKDEPETTSHTTDPPPSCKKCFTKFADRKSMVCSHEFCSECWETMVELPNPTDGKKSKKGEDETTGNPSLFTCSVCGASNKSVRPKSAYPVKQVENLGKDVKKQNSFKVILKRNKLFPGAMTWSPTDEFILVDCSTKELLVLTAAGEVKKHFPYLRNHVFQGGLTVDKEGIIRIALKNDRFSGVSYYTSTGQFKYSAFLYDETPHVGDVVSLDMDECGNMVALDLESSKICYISMKKRVESHPVVSINGAVAGENDNPRKETDKNDKAGIQDEAASADVGLLVVSEANVKEEALGDSDKGADDNQNQEQPTSQANNPSGAAKVVKEASRSATDGLVSIAVNSWRQAFVCDQAEGVIYIIERHEHYDVEVGRLQLADQIKPCTKKEASLKAIIDEHDNVLLLDRSTNRILRYNTEGQYLDTLVQFPVIPDSGNEDDEDDFDDDVRYTLRDISCNMKGVLSAMYTREQTLVGEGDKGTEGEGAANLGRRTEIALYSYSTPRKQRRKERKEKENKTSSDDKPAESGQSKSKCCVIV